MYVRRLIIYSFLLLSGCATTRTPQRLSYKAYPISRSLPRDSTALQLLAPYAKTMHEQMNSVIGFSNNALYKKQPESALGNFFADCLKSSATLAYHTPVDVAVVNEGGIRSYIPKGEIKLEHVYELMPFDNAIVLQKVSGNTLLQLLDRAAYDGGWPVAGITMKIKAKAAAEVLVNGVPLSEKAQYTLAVSDYLANGGDGCAMLKNIAQQNKNYLFRDALISCIKAFTAAGKPLTAAVENRVVYANE